MSHAEPTTTGAVEAGEKMTASGIHQDLESNEEKATTTIVPNGPSYTSQGTEEERALIFKQDLRIIPLCSFSPYNLGPTVPTLHSD